MYDEDYGLPAEQWRKKWDPVFAIDYKVVALSQAQVGERGQRIDRRLTTNSVESYTVQRLYALARSIPFAYPAHFASCSDPPLGNLMHVRLSPTCPRMCDVSPVEDQDPRWMSTPPPGTHIVQSAPEEPAEESKGVGYVC